MENTSREAGDDSINLSLSASPMACKLTNAQKLISRCQQFVNISWCNQSKKQEILFRTLIREVSRRVIRMIIICCSAYSKNCHWSRPCCGKYHRLFHKFGDGGANILPLYRLNKRQGDNSYGLVQTQLFMKKSQQDGRQTWTCRRSSSRSYNWRLPWPCISQKPKQLSAAQGQQTPQGKTSSGGVCTLK